MTDPSDSLFPGGQMMNKPLVIVTNLLAAIAPYFTFMEYHAYPYLTPEAGLYLLFFASLGLAAGIIAASMIPRRAVMVTALVMFFSYDLQFNNSFSSNIIFLPYMAVVVILLRKLDVNGYKICLAALGAFIFSALIIGVEGRSSDVTFAASTPDAGQDADRPVIVHIILDEHIGLEGVPLNVPGAAEFVRDTRDIYENQGFTIFGNAYSENSYTRFSLALAMNNVSELKDELQLSADGDQWMNQIYNLPKNSYLQEMSKRGYRVFVRQSSYMNLCGAGQVVYARCQTYDYSKLAGIVETRFSISNKLLLFTSFHLQNTRTRKALIVAVRAMETSWGFVTGGNTSAYKLLWANRLFSWERRRIGPLSHADAIERLGEEVVKAKPGDLFLSHFLQPHFPYVYDAKCNIRPVSKWEHRGTNPGYDRKDQELRERIYEGYFATTRCINKKIENFTERLKKAGVLDKTIIIIHGDHGSRILINELYEDELDDPVAHKEAHSTLFAVRIPGKKAPYRKQAGSIRQLLWELIDNGFSAPPQDIDRGEATIQVPDIKQKKYVRIKYLGVNPADVNPADVNPADK